MPPPHPIAAVCGHCRRAMQQQEGHSIAYAVPRAKLDALSPHTTWHGQPGRYGRHRDTGTSTHQTAMCCTAALRGTHRSTTHADRLTKTQTHLGPLIAGPLFASAGDRARLAHTRYIARARQQLKQPVVLVHTRCTHAQHCNRSSAATCQACPRCSYSRASLAVLLPPLLLLRRRACACRCGWCCAGLAAAAAVLPTLSWPACVAAQLL
jgi:hypothetical protein